MTRSKVSCPRRMFPVRFGGAFDTLIVKRTRSEESDEKDGCWHMVCAPHLLGSGARSKIPAIPTTGYQQFSLLGRSEPWSGRIVRPSAQHWKCCIPSPVSRVQIPLAPRSFLKLYDKFQGASRDGRLLESLAVPELVAPRSIRGVSSGMGHGDSFPMRVFDSSRRDCATTCAHGTRCSRQGFRAETQQSTVNRAGSWAQARRAD